MKKHPPAPLAEGFFFKKKKRRSSPFLLLSAWLFDFEWTWKIWSALKLRKCLEEIWGRRGSGIEKFKSEKNRNRDAGLEDANAVRLMNETIVKWLFFYYYYYVFFFF